MAADATEKRNSPAKQGTKTSLLRNNGVISLNREKDFIKIFQKWSVDTMNSAPKN